jgi:hypothetical protein
MLWCGHRAWASGSYYKLRRRKERASTKCDTKDCVKIQENGEFASAETYEMETVLEAKEETFLIHTIMVRLEACSSSHQLILALHKYLLTYELYCIILFGTLLSFIPYVWLNYLCQ